ncbi:hypothetical protein A7R79_30015 [Pseudomonas aeruginosa]|nr:hypothetical protein BMR72_08125 [Pseudomonas aeruginosa]OES64714.1 hypothetical protein A7R79_30015 [Pseudomonas aeruginosa]OFQ74913.1 hypothetical protein HMPREF2924_20560 [Pseudomonas sp. HMSC063H08]OXY98979.1 hypothetical protein ACG87_27815 [Pseudomonas aeruginosa]RIZ10666.1 hypothetical protein AXW98_08900 [Pseudomonas aeruginosa]
MGRAGFLQQDFHLAHGVGVIRIHAKGALEDYFHLAACGGFDERQEQIAYVQVAGGQEHVSAIHTLQGGGDGFRFAEIEGRTLDSIHFPICAGSGLDGLSLGQQAFD